MVYQPFYVWFWNCITKLSTSSLQRLWIKIGWTWSSASIINFPFEVRFCLDKLNLPPLLGSCLVRTKRALTGLCWRSNISTSLPSWCPTTPKVDGCFLLYFSRTDIRPYVDSGREWTLSTLYLPLVEPGVLTQTQVVENVICTVKLSAKVSMTQAVLPLTKILGVWSLGYSFSYTSFSPRRLTVICKVKGVIPRSSRRSLGWRSISATL